MFWTFGNDFREECANVVWEPMHTKRNMQDVHTEVSHAAVLAIRRYPPLPVDWLMWIEITAMQKARLHLQDRPKSLLADETQNFLCAWEEWKLRGAAHHYLWVP